MDANRISVPEEDIDNYYCNLERILPSIRAQFCYNVDEVGYLEREDAREVYVIVRADYPMKTCYYSIDQNSKRAKAIHCICTDAEFIPPTIITSRMTVESSIDTILPKESYKLVYQTHGFVNTEIFRDWFLNSFLYLLKLKRFKYGYKGYALLILDGFIAHKKIIEEENKPEFKLIVLFLVAHSSDQTQPLDLGTFGIAKRYVYKFDNLDNSPSKLVTNLK